MSNEPKTPVTITLRDGDPELQAISHMISIVEFFQPEQRRRMIDYLCARFPVVDIVSDRK